MVNNKTLVNSSTFDIIVSYNSMWNLLNVKNENNEKVLQKWDLYKKELINEGLMKTDNSLESHLETLLELYLNEYNIRRQN